MICVTRGKGGELLSVEPLCDQTERRESVMYIELDRADARTRQDLVAELHQVLSDVRLAVQDWREAIALFLCPVDEERSIAWFRLAVADFAAVYLALALDTERALRS